MCRSLRNESADPPPQKERPDPPPQKERPDPIPTKGTNPQNRIRGESAESDSWRIRGIGFMSQNRNYSFCGITIPIQNH
ncbi:hypothetical protein AVEN_44952-1 [Araneus ventricosus]|uniref:Uncharacterized protein n=1 Tax=Araneus ventricosus TaxID=182803 RepID=A0A4Y2UKI1_ARAVE|nr:hypothetical protein AVEN_44952-1 [Araneus ventricosus]